MKGMKVIITRENPHSGYGYYKAGDTGLLVGFTEGCAVVVKDNEGKFVKVELRDVMKLTDQNYESKRSTREDLSTSKRKDIKEKCCEVLAKFLDKEGYFSVEFDPREINIDKLGKA